MSKTVKAIGLLLAITILGVNAEEDFTTTTLLQGQVKLPVANRTPCYGRRVDLLEVQDKRRVVVIGHCTWRTLPDSYSAWVVDLSSQSKPFSYVTIAGGPSSLLKYGVLGAVSQDAGMSAFDQPIRN